MHRAAFVALLVSTGLMSGPGRAQQLANPSAPTGQVDAEPNSPRLAQSEVIEAPTASRSGLVGTYLGGSSYPEPNLFRLRDGHLQILGQTGSWGSQTDLLTIVANIPYRNDGNQGGFWDPAYRIASGGQDAGAMLVLIQGRKPIGREAGVSSYGYATIATPAGDRTVYTVALRKPLDAAELDEMRHRPPNMRLETKGGYFGYLIPPGYRTPSGAELPPWSADGSTLVVDNWVCASCKPQIAASASATPAASDPVTIDVLHQIDGLYGGWRVDDFDGLQSAMNAEHANVNDRQGKLPPLNLFDPQSSQPLLVGRFDGVTTDRPDGQGTGVAHDLCTTGWQACFVARNMQTPQSGVTFGFVAPSAGPTFGFYSAQRGGYVLGVDPGDGCQQPGKDCHRTVLLDTGGNLALSGLVTAHSVQAAADIVASGLVVPGHFQSDALPACNPGSLGAHVYVLDGRKPGERAGAGSGVPADCTPPVVGGGPIWLSVYDHRGVSR